MEDRVPIELLAGGRAPGTPRVPTDLRADLRAVPITGSGSGSGEDTQADVAASWPIGRSTPKPVEDLLRLSRQLFVHSAFAPEFLTLSADHALRATEAAFRRRLEAGSRVDMARLIRRAQRSGLIDEDTAAVLEDGRRLRDHFALPEPRFLWTAEMATPLLATAHRVVADLFTPLRPV